MTNVSRRTVLGVGAAAVLAASSAVTVPAVVSDGSRWPGHQPGKIYLGMTTSAPLAAAVRRTGPIGVHRHFYQWDELVEESRAIARDHASSMLPWTSFKPPSGGSSSWRAVADGRYDGAIRARARAYAAQRRPVVVTFHHEPAEEGRTGDLPRQFRRAWRRVHDVMKDETGLRNVVSVPIIGEYTFNPRNSEDDPDEWATPEILSRCHFFGVDLYQNASGEGLEVRLGRVREHLRRMGYPDLMLGLGEIGCTDGYGSPDGATWWDQQWSWIEQHTDQIGVVAYYNSSRSSRGKPTWVLAESPAKLRAFQKSLRSPVCARL